jgi:hypothetical protein
VAPFVRLADVEFLRIADFGLTGELPPPVTAKLMVVGRQAAPTANCR